MSQSACSVYNRVEAIITMITIVLLSSVRLSGQEPCVGWATVDGTTTGGAGGAVTTVTNESSFANAVKGNNAKIVKVSGTITLSGEIRPGSNTTIEAAGPGATIIGSLSLIGSSSADLTNVIIRNLIIKKLGGDGEDAISVRRAHHIWIDHNELWDSPDGLLDVTNGSNYVTISWNVASYSSNSASHRYAMLFGNSDNAGDEDQGKLKITLHHNWFSDNVIERMPRVRFGQIHVFNNYYSSSGNNYCIGPGYQAKVVVESNYFENVKDPHKFYDGEATAQIKINDDNQYVNTTGARDEGQGNAFTPPYQYTPHAGASVKGIVMSGAGPFKVAAIQNKPGADFIIKDFANAAPHKGLKGMFTLQGRSIFSDRALPAAGPYIIVKEKPFVIIMKQK